MCRRAHITPFPFTIPTTCTDTTSRPHRAWRPARRNLRVAYCAPPPPLERLPNVSTCPTAAWTVCTWSATPPAANRGLAAVMAASMAPLHRCPCTWFEAIENKPKTDQNTKQEQLLQFFCSALLGFQSFIIQNVWHIGVSSLPLWHWWHQLFSVDLLHTCLINRQTKMELKCYLPSKRMDIQAKNDPSNLLLLLTCRSQQCANWSKSTEVWFLENGFWWGFIFGAIMAP